MDAFRRIKLHPSATDFLFENFAILRRIFSDVLGQLEIDYISIALINEKKEIFFLSSSPSIEQNLIEKNLWECDYIYQQDFVYQNGIKLWSELSPLEYPALHYKQKNKKLIEGVSIPFDYGKYRVILSFGFKEMRSLIKDRSHNYIRLLTIGRYCLNKINKVILFPDVKKFNTKPPLTLIVNNIGKL